MNNYRVFETEEFLNKLKKLHKKDSDFLQKKLREYVYPQIKRQPSYGKNIKKLRGYTPDTWRYRIGKFRLFYTFDEDQHIIYMLTVDHRKQAYR